MRRAFLARLAVHRIIEAKNDPSQMPQWLADALAAMTPEEAANILWIEMQGDLAEGIADAKAALSITGAFDVTPERALRYLADHILDFASGMVDNERAGLRSLVTDGLEQGWGAEKLKRQIHEFFRGGVHYVGDDGTTIERTINLQAWSETVARTELSRAYNQGSRSVYEEAGITERIWVTAGDANECPECEAADGEIAKIGDPFPSVDVSDPPAHPRCCPPGTLIATPDGLRAIEEIAVGDLVISHTGAARPVLATISNEISEELVELRINSTRLRLTSNHPICTPNGWTRADALKPGDQIIRVTSKAVRCFSLESQHVPPKRREARSLPGILGPLALRSMPVSAVDLKGNSEVDECNVNAKLLDRVIGDGSQAEALDLIKDDALVLRLDAVRSGERPSAPLVERVGSASRCVMGLFGQALAILGRRFPVASLLSRAHVVPLEPEALPRGIDRDARHPSALGNRQHGLASDVRGVHRPGLVIEQPPRWHAAIVSLDATERPYYSGPVYNMQVDVDESYVAEGIAVHNCYCVTMGSPEQIARYKSPEMVAHRRDLLTTNQAWAGAHPKRKRARR